MQVWQDLSFEEQSWVREKSKERKFQVMGPGPEVGMTGTYLQNSEEGFCWEELIRQSHLINGLDECSRTTVPANIFEQESTRTRSILYNSCLKGQPTKRAPYKEKLTLLQNEDQ